MRLDLSLYIKGAYIFFLPVKGYLLNTETGAVNNLPRASLGLPTAGVVN